MDFLVIKILYNCFLSWFKLRKFCIHRYYTKLRCDDYHLFTNFEIMASKSKVYFFFDNVKHSTLDNANKLKRLIEHIFKKEEKNLDQAELYFLF